MFKFFLKKSFFDAWDNMFALVCLNAAFIAIVAAGIWLPSLADSAPVRAAGLAFIVIAGSAWWSAAAHALTRAADSKAVRLADILEAAPAGLIPGVQFGGVAAAALALASVVMPFYASIDNFFGLFATSLSFWIFLCLALVMQYMLPWRAANGGTFRESIRASFLLFMDAPAFSLALALDGLLCVVVSPLVAFLLPGPAAAVMASCDAVRLRSLKLKWMAEPGHPPKPVPWSVLLAEDEEALGPRGFKDLIFPWKR